MEMQKGIENIIPNGMIRVVQLPIIENQLRAVKDEIENRVSMAMSLACTEDTILAVKKVRAELNKEFEKYEKGRKAVKTAILAPLVDFDAVYKECVSDAYKLADSSLKSKIEDIENEKKNRCEESLREYFEELVAVHHLDWLKYESAGIKVDMASAKAKTPSRLRKQLAEFVVKVNNDVNMILSMENSEEIMVEFRKTLDATKAIQTVLDRHRLIADERIAKKSRAEETAKENLEVQKVEEAKKEYLRAPLAVSVAAENDDDEIIPKVTFTALNATRGQLRRLKEFMEKEVIKYE